MELRIIQSLRKSIKKKKTIKKAAINLMMSWLPKIDRLKIKDKVVFTQKTENILYLLLEALLYNKAENKKEVESYFLAVLRNISRIDYSPFLSLSDPMRLKSIERVTYNLLAFTDAYLGKGNTYQRNVIENSLKTTFDGVLLRVMKNENIDEIKIGDGGEISQILRYKVLTDGLLSLYPTNYKIFECLDVQNLARFLENSVQRASKDSDYNGLDWRTLSVANNLINTKEILDPKMIHLIETISFKNLTGILKSVKKGKRFLVSYAGLLNASVQIVDNTNSGTSKTDDFFQISGVKRSTLQSINTCLSLMIAKRDSISILSVKGVCNIIYFIAKEYSFHTEIHETIYNFTKKIFKLEYLQKLKNEKRMNMNLSEDKEKLNKLKGLNKCYSSLLIKVYEISIVDLDSFKSIQASKLYALITKILDELVNEETSVKLVNKLNEQEIDKALSRDSQSLRNIIVPVYEKVLNLLYNICKFSQSDVLTDLVVKLLVQRYKFLKIFGMCEISSKNNEVRFYLEMMRHISKMAMLKKDETSILDISKQIIYKLMKVKGKGKMEKVREILDYLMLDLIKTASPERLVKMIKLTSAEMIGIRFQEEYSLSSSSFQAEKTIIYIMWINKMLNKLDHKPNFNDETTLNQGEIESFMNIWQLVVMDYPYMKADFMTEIEKFAVLSPPLIESSQRIYSNSMLRHNIFNSISTSEENKFKSVTKKMMDNLDVKLKKFSASLRPNELSFAFAVSISLDCKIRFMEENPEVCFELMGEKSGMIGSILTYLDNYLLYSNGGSHFQVALEKIIDFYSARYVRALSRIQIVSLKLGIARQDFIVISQFACCETESFSKICVKLLQLYTTIFPPIFFKRRVVETVKAIITHLWNKLSSEYSLATEILSVPFIPQNTRLPSNSEKIKKRLSIILSAIVRLYLRARAINVFITKTAISFTVQKSLKNNSNSQDFGLQFIIMLGQVDPKYNKIETSRDKFMTLWMKDKKEFDEKLDIDSKSIPHMIKQLYNGLLSPVKLNLDDLNGLVKNISLPVKSYLDDFIGSLDFDRDYICKKLKAFNKNCFNLEFCHLVELTKGQFNFRCLNPKARKMVDKKLREKDENKLVNLASENSDVFMNQIYEDLSFLMNLIHNKKISSISLLDKVLEIVSMYRVPKLYQHFFEDFLPNQMRVAAFKVDNLLILLRRIISNLNRDFSSTSYENLYNTNWSDGNIFTVKTKLFSKIYQNYFLFQNLKEDCHSIETSSKLKDCISCVSPSMQLKYLMVYKLEPSNSKCLDYFVDFIHKMLPVAFMMGKKMTLLISVFKLMMSIEQKSVSKINIDSYCKFNLSFLDMWRIVQKTKHRHSDLVDFHINRVIEKFYFFNVNYFAWTKYSSDLNKESYLISKITKVETLVKELSLIHQEITHLYNTLEIDTIKRKIIYGRYSRDKKVFSDFKKVYLAKFSNAYSVRRVVGILGFGDKQLDSRPFFINVSPYFDSSDLVFKVRTLLTSISHLIADEIDKIRANFFMSLEHVSNLHTLETAKFSMDEMRNYALTLFYLNPISSLAFVERFKFTIKTKSLNFDWIHNLYGDTLEKLSELFITKKEFLSLYIDYMYQSDKEMLEEKHVIMFWRMPHIQVLFKYINEKYDKVKIVIDYFAKNMLRIDSEILTFYLAQIFQSLNNSCAPIVENFLLDYAKTSPLLAHQLIWLANVERKKEPSDHKKGKQLEVDRTKQKRQLAAGLGDKIIRNMGMDEINLWNNFDEFYNSVTKISSKLDAKWEKAKKKKVLNDMLNEVSIPELVYLPTNPRFKVVDIKKDHGKPLQSAARCPIMVVFYCRKFEGPDQYFQKMKKLVNEFDKKEELDMMLKDMNEIEETPSINKPKVLFPNGLSGSNIFKAPLVNSVPQKSRFRGIEKSIDQKDLKNKYKMEPVRTKSKSKSGHPLNLNIDNKSSKLDILTNNIYQDHTINLSAKKFQQDASMFDFYVSSPVKVNKAYTTAKKKPTESNKIMIRKTQDHVQNLTEISCIFKTRDDIRQDNLALQVIRIFQDIFAKAKLDLYVAPYKTISSRTGQNQELGGIIEFVPNSNSRDQIGKENNYDLYRFFNERFGNELSPMFQAARENFIRSMAAYSIVSYMLQIKDRHNGNILIDEFGHLIHIDFGFIFDISPGGNMKFENAEFKLTSEMIQIMGGSEDSEPFKLFVDLTVRAFLVVRQYREHLYNVVELIYESGMGCFMPESLQRFKERFMEDKNDFAAAKQMKKIIENAYKNLRTMLYDEIQYIQQKIAR